jgi:hypothetical protein
MNHFRATFSFLSLHTHIQSHANMESTKPLPNREQFLESCLLTPTTTDEDPCSICLDDYEVAPPVADTAEEHLRHTICQTPS